MAEPNVPSAPGDLPYRRDHVPSGLGGSRSEGTNRSDNETRSLPFRGAVPGTGRAPQPAGEMFRLFGGMFQRLGRKLQRLGKRSVFFGGCSVFFGETSAGKGGCSRVALEHPSNLLEHPSDLVEHPSFLGNGPPKATEQSPAETGEEGEAPAKKDAELSLYRTSPPAPPSPAGEPPDAAAPHTSRRSGPASPPPRRAPGGRPPAEGLPGTAGSRSRR
jgi:hypothetical protein